MLLLRHTGIVHLARRSLLLWLAGCDALLHLHRALLLLLLVESGLLLRVLLLLLELLLVDGALLLLLQLDLLRILVLLRELGGLLASLRPLLLLLQESRLLLLMNLLAIKLRTRLLLGRVAELTSRGRSLLAVSRSTLNWRQRKSLVRLLFLSCRLLLLKQHLVDHLLLLRVLVRLLLVDAALVLLRLHGELLLVAILDLLLHLLLSGKIDARLLQLGLNVGSELIALVAGVVTRVDGHGQAHLRRHDQVVVVLNSHLGETLGLAGHWLSTLNVNVHLLFLDEFAQARIFDVRQDNELQDFEPLVRAKLDLEGLIFSCLRVRRLDCDVETQRPGLLFSIMAGTLLAGSGLIHVHTVDIAALNQMLRVVLLRPLLLRLGYDLRLSVRHLLGGRIYLVGCRGVARRKLLSNALAEDLMARHLLQI